MVDGGSLTIELATKHLGGDGHAEHIASELTMGVGVVDVGGTFENLRDKIKSDICGSSILISEEMTRQKVWRAPPQEP